MQKVNRVFILLSKKHQLVMINLKGVFILLM